MKMSLNRFLQSLRWLALLLLAVVVASCSGAGNCAPNNVTVVDLHTFPNGSQLFGTTSLNITSGESTTATYVLKGGSGLTVVNLSTQESGLNTAPLSYGLTRNCALCGSFNPESLVVTGTSAESSSQLTVNVRSGLTAGTYTLNLYATYTNDGVTQDKEQIGVISVTVTAATAQPGVLAIYSVAESTINVGESTTAVISLNNSSGITEPVDVTIASNDTAVMTVSPANCTLTTASNSCTVTLTGVAAGTTTFNAAATGYITATSEAVTVNPIVITGWTKQVGASGGRSYGKGISLDAAGNSYITGYTTVGLSGQTQIGSEDYYIAKYDPSGNLLWTKQVGAAGGSTYGRGIATDLRGNSYVTGYTTQALSGESQTGANDCFVAKYDTDGNLIWTKQLGSVGGVTWGNGIAVEPVYGSLIYITGYTTKKLSDQTQAGNNDYFIAKYDRAGALQWVRQVGTAGGDTQGNGISIATHGAVFIVGSTTKGISGQTQNGTYDYFVTRYDSFGSEMWTKQAGAAGGYVKGYGIGVDRNGASYITGSTNVALAGQSQVGVFDYFVAKYDVIGGFEWSRQSAPLNYGQAYGSGISVDNVTGDSYATGYTVGSLNGQPAVGGSDYYIVKYAIDGSLQWTTQVGAVGGATNGVGISIDSAGTSYITGDTNVALPDQTQTGNIDYFINKTPNL